MNHEKHEKNCAFSEDLIDYLYGETGAVENEKFTAHLLECGACRMEISAFGAVRSSIVEWRNQDFAMLQTPSVVLPPIEKTTFEPIETKSESHSRLSFLRHFLSFSPTRNLAAACAALLICAGLFFTAMNFVRDDGKDISETNTKISGVDAIVSPTVETIAGNTNSAAVNADKSVKPKIEKIPEIQKPELPSDRKATVISVKNIEPARPKIHSKPLNTKPLTKSSAAQRNDVKIVEEEQEDTLRLADLFDEIGE